MVALRCPEIHWKVNYGAGANQSSQVKAVLIFKKANFWFENYLSDRMNEWRTLEVDCDVTKKLRDLKQNKIKLRGLASFGNTILEVTVGYAGSCLYTCPV